MCPNEAEPRAQRYAIPGLRRDHSPFHPDARADVQRPVAQSFDPCRSRKRSHAVQDPSENYELQPAGEAFSNLNSTHNPTHKIRCLVRLARCLLIRCKRNPAALSLEGPGKTS